VLSVAQVARRMALQGLAVAVSDSDTAKERHAAINQGLIGAVLNAHDKGVPLPEIVEVLRCGSGLRSLAEALADSSASLSDAQRELLDRLVAAGANADDHHGSGNG